MPIGRTFHGLDGFEVKAIIRSELKSDLMDRMQSYFGRELRVTFDFKLELAYYPGEQIIRVALKGERSGTGELIVAGILAAIAENLDRDTNFGRHLTFPKVTWDHRMELKAFALTDEVPTKAVAPPTISARHRVDADLRGPVQEQQVLDVHGRPFHPTTDRVLVEADPRDEAIRQLTEQMATIAAQLATLSGRENAKVAVDRVIAPEESNPKARTLALTGTGLPITGGAMPSPGPAMAESWGKGSDVAGVLIEEMSIGRSHPKLEEGGMAAPDALRRENGLPIPTPQRDRQSGQIMDFPASVF